jgi:hypothetical protein
MSQLGCIGYEYSRYASNPGGGFRRCAALVTRDDQIDIAVDFPRSCYRIKRGGFELRIIMLGDD